MNELFLPDRPMSTEQCISYLKAVIASMLIEMDNLKKKIEVLTSSALEELDNYTQDDSFLEELIEIKGIGLKTAKDIVTWGTKEKLIEQIKLKAELPFRDDIVKKLREKYA